jgi:ubiquitin fusion degradation protein 1
MVSSLLLENEILLTQQQAFQGGYFEDEDPMAMYNMLQRGGRGATMKRFDEYYRCYPTVMLPGPDRDHLNFGGKIILPPSALEKLTRLHITYPMLFELYNGQAEKTTHAGVLEFVAEEGKVYLPNWVCPLKAWKHGE